ncbi:DUF1120 domain-containing protein [Pantoea dispersa]|uniref:DUF1120 domain-containing protein n=1 Tax=Pantoea dispersa TaxID=59814 RepID=UPI002DB7ADE6|nr:DUF1120 domain-containing protein [Pantoea dispersa]MEB5974115.1 DUF1120 domain-containing protein [Pantoea dispersa]
MMKKMMKTTCALAVLAASCNVMAESVDMRVTGAVTPIACKPMLSDNGVVDLGELNTNMLKKDEVTIFQPKRINLTIDCTAPAKISLLATSARPGTTLGAADEGPTGATKPIINPGLRNGGGVAGLGMDGDKKIGAYGLNIWNMVMDGVTGSGVKSSDKKSWNDWYANTFFSDFGVYKYVSWRKAGSEMAPSAFKNLTAEIEVVGYINKASELDLTKPIKLDGQTNFEMFYL